MFTRASSNYSDKTVRYGRFIKNIYLYFILSSEINAYHKHTKMIPFICEMIFHCSDFWITSDFSIQLMHFTSEFQTRLTRLFVKENIKCGYAFSKLGHDDYFGTKIIWVC